MARRKPCLTCGEQEKAKGNAKDCHECWLVRQPVHVQVEHARRRLEMVPEPLRLKEIPDFDVPAGRRWCYGCQTFVRERDFPATGLKCSACKATVRREYRLEREYSIGQRDYDALFEAQGGRCFLCGRRSHTRPLAVDHDHRTGEVRGLLCPDPEYGCNLKVVPRFDADPDPRAMALRLLRYLTNPPAREVLNR